MANQQSKKTDTAQTSGAGTGGSSTSSSSAIPAAGQDKTQPSTMNAQSPTSSPNTGQNTNRTGSATGDKAIGSADHQPISEKLGSTATGILDKAKETASGTYDAVATQATTRIEEQKGELSTGLKTLADTFRKTGDELHGTERKTPLTDLTARYSGTAATQIEKVADYFERKDLRAMMRDVEGFARRNPAIFLGAAFGLGMIAARFLKSSPPKRGTSETDRLNPNLPTALPPATDRPGVTPTR